MEAMTVEQRRVNVDFLTWMIEALDRGQAPWRDAPVDHQGVDCRAIRAATNQRGATSVHAPLPALKCTTAPLTSVTTCGTR